MNRLQSSAADPAKRRPYVPPRLCREEAKTLKSLLEQVAFTSGPQHSATKSDPRSTQK